MSENTKTDAKNLHPMENLSFELYKQVSPTLRNMQLTPNMLTTISILFSFASAFSIYKNQYMGATIFILLSYIFDVFDGAFAREYKMYSQFGKVYDHFSDIIMALVVLGVFYRYNPLKRKSKWLVFSIIGFLLVMTYVSQGCLSRVLEEEQKDEKKDEEEEGQKNTETMIPKSIAFRAEEIVNVAEKMHDKTFDDTKKMCVGNSTDMIQITKYFGGETYTIFLAAVFLAIHFKILK